MSSAAKSRTPKSTAVSNGKSLPSSFKVGGKQVDVTNLQKVLYPESGFTKGQVVDYYLRIAPFMLPHLAGRPLTLKRYPNGVDQMFFYEKRCPAHRPKWVSTGKVWSEGNDDYINYCVVKDAATMVWLANLACLEMHTLLSRLPKDKVPTSMVFDLDPGPPATVLDSIRVGLKMRDTLRKLGLESFAKTSGSKGIHLWAPLNTPVTFEQTKHFSHAIALLMERENPREVLSVMKRDLRAGKVFVDWSQNDEHKTTACVYTLRARTEPTVSTPVSWDELATALKKKDPARVTFKTADVLKRVEKFGDLFAPVLKLKQRLPKGKGTLPDV
ncbi:MAG TPA: non-homologous end-joining DNA ligase [Tepidisphaeraceae bacterium]|jgi:bifunctional non-homologous end joining protein LigD